MAEDSKPAAVYVSFPTLKNAIAQFVQLIPNQIDRSNFPGLSGGVQSQLFAGLKFLGLMSDDNKPTDELRELAVSDEGKRKEKLKKILQERYAELFALDLLKTTPDELTNRIGTAYNVSGDTREKAVRFFLQAVGYVGIPVSKLFDRQYGTGSGNGVKTRRKSTPRSRASDNDETPPATKHGTSRVVNLKSGGTLTLTASIDIFQLTADDRAFVFSLIDELEKYEKQNQ